MTNQRRWGHRNPVVNLVDTAPFPLVLFVGMALGVPVGLAVAWLIGLVA